MCFIWFIPNLYSPHSHTYLELKGVVLALSVLPILIDISTQSWVIEYVFLFDYLSCVHFLSVSSSCYLQESFQSILSDLFSVLSAPFDEPSIQVNQAFSLWGHMPTPDSLVHW